MKYYRISYDGRKADLNKNIFCDKCENFSNLDQYIVCNGKSLNNNWEKVILTYNSKLGNTFTDYLDNVLCWLVVSNKFIELTEKYSKDLIEYLPVDIKDRKTNLISNNYKAMNIINVIDDAIDLEKTNYIKILGDVEEGRCLLGATKYVLKEKQIKGNHIFKSSDDILRVFVSEKIKNLIEENNITGFYFHNVNLS